MQIAQLKISVKCPIEFALKILLPILFSRTEVEPTIIRVRTKFTESEKIKNFTVLNKFLNVEYAKIHIHKYGVIS